MPKQSVSTRTPDVKRAYVGSDDLHTDIVRALVYLNVTTMNRYLPALMALLFGDSSPVEAIAHVEAADGKA